MQDKKIVYIARDTMGVLNNGVDKKFSSDYIERYKENLIKLENKDKWKFTGQSAMFQGRMQESTEVSISINGVTSFSEDSYLYTASTGEVSGIFSKDYSSGEENFIIHTNKKIFHSVDYSTQKKQIITSLSESITKDLAIFDFNTNDLSVITDGDSLDENPTFSRFNNDIYFNSRGIARNKNMHVMGIGNSSLYTINHFYLDVNEILTEKGFDLMLPKTDKNGNVYYIRKPYKNNASSSGILLDILLLPFRLIMGIGKMLFFLSKLSAKKDDTNAGVTGGVNPAKFKEKSEKELFIFEESIDPAREESNNSKKGIKNAGYAPYNYELWKMDSSGNKTIIKNSVLYYDVDEEGNIVYTNGKYIFSLDTKGNEEVVHKDKIITSVCFQ